ncbi:outer membrane protein OmpK [Vibrio sp. WXL103]|uniref:nucleoside-specific channel-forming Tsx family protein n=1 Tax=Vibrio sp. WXL103 TaxID=3450710 RepID=UPI003EC4AA5F
MRYYLIIILAMLSVSRASWAEDIHANDYKWFQFNIMHTIDQYPHPVGGSYKDTYLEMEFGGRSGIWALYGYVDVFDITDSDSSSQNETGGLFMKIEPRMSIDGLTRRDLSIGPINEWYVATLHNFGSNQQEHFIGPGVDITVPWLGKMGANLYARYSAKNFGNEDEGSFNGYQFSTNWFKPFYTLSNDSYFAFQGYWDHLFGAKEYRDQPDRTTSGGNVFLGLYWHSDRYALGYGLKYFYDVYGIKDGVNSDSTGAGHYFSAIYKF